MARQGEKMEIGLKIFISVSLLNLYGCCFVSDDLKAVTAFSPYITKDGQQSFRFVANTKLPSYYGDADPQEMHESLI
jgi:hypothetical protein